ncbi:MAG: PqqD family protein [Candidatus Rokubacteria bacterium]|nr:PqqD family protein [Candidatus Rokubacteria bacterium]
MSAAGLASRVRIGRHTVFRDLEGETVLLNLRTGVYFGLDPVGTRIWHLLREEQPLERILASLVEEYEVATPRCEEDLLGFVGLLQEHELVEVPP